MIRKTIGAFCFSSFCLGSLLAAEDTNVVLEQTGSRTEARLKADDLSRSEGRSEGDILAKAFSPVERGIFGTASGLSDVVGKGADAAVGAVQQAGNLVLSPLFGALDVRNIVEKKEQEHTAQVGT